MARKVILSGPATADMNAARGWLRQPGAGRKAVERLRSISKAIRDLKAAPCRWPEGDHPGVREIPVAGYRVMYEVSNDTGDTETAGDVVVVRVFGPGQLRTRL